MHIFNRIMMTIGSLCLVLGSSTLFLITIGIIVPQDWLPAPWHEVLVPFTQLDTSQGLSVVSICLGVLIVGMLLLFVELRSLPTKVPALILKKDDLGKIAASIRSIQDLANREAETIEGVKESLTHVKNTSRGIHLQCRLSVAQNANAAQLGQLVQERIKTSVENYLGKPLAGIHLQTQMVPPGKGTQKDHPRVR
jgi:hypothetical protein